MSVYLLDINVLIALQLTGHASHGLAVKWFNRSGRSSYATCGFTQAGFVRLITSPIFADERISMSEAIELIQILSRSKQHVFWPTEVDFSTATNAFQPRLHSSKQVTDVYLLGLAKHRKGKLATMDRALLHLAGPEFADSVELIR